jgi:DNA invertase Pin-like site-specific DNA recombinase
LSYRTTTRTPLGVIVIDIYCRISRDYDGTLRSVEAQEEQGRAWIAEHAHEGYVVGQVHRDHAKSAWNPRVVRPSFNDLMARLEAGEAHGVWVRNLDRFTRKPMEGEKLLEYAERGTIVLAGDGHYDLTTARGIKAFREDMVDAAFESDRIKERTKRGKRAKAYRGKSNATFRGFARYGYLPAPEGWEQGDPRQLVPDTQLAAEQAAVRDAADRLLAGESFQQIALEWNAAGLLTVTGSQWTGATVRQMLTSPGIAGLVTYGQEQAPGRTYRGEIVGVMDGEHALDRETWERLQSSFASRKRGRPATQYLLSGLMRCGKCGQRLYGRPRGRTSPYEDGSMRREYWCQPVVGKETGGCGRLAIDWRFADNVMKQATITRLGDPRHTNRLTQRAVKVEKARSEMVSERARLHHDRKQLATKTAQWGFEAVNAAMEPITARLAELDAKLEALEAPDTTATTDATVEWEAANLRQQRAMVTRAFPEGITVLPATSTGRKARLESRFYFGPPSSVIGKDVVVA